MRTVYEALQPLDEQARERVWTYVSQRLAMRTTDERQDAPRTNPPKITSVEQQEPPGDDPGEDGGALDGVSPVAVKWMKRSGFSADCLSRVFSIGLDEIDLVASSVPGSSKRERLHNVFRLSAMAAYLSSGAARVSAEELKEACQHYDAYDVANHAKNLKALGREISGTKESGYTLTATGITGATKLIKDMIGEFS
jgi:hypothetical protein